MAGLMLEERREAWVVMVGCHQDGRQEEGVALEEQEKQKGGTGRGGAKSGISKTKAGMRPRRGLDGGVSEALREHRLAT